MLLLFIFLVFRHITLLVASLVVARNWSPAWAWLHVVVLMVSLSHRFADMLPTGDCLVHNLIYVG